MAYQVKANDTEQITIKLTERGKTTGMSRRYTIETVGSAEIMDVAFGRDMKAYIVQKALARAENEFTQQISTKILELSHKELDKEINKEVSKYIEEHREEIKAKLVKKMTKDAMARIEEALDDEIDY